MGETKRLVWNSLDDADKRMIQSDCVYYGTGCGGETEVGFYDVIRIMRFDWFIHVLPHAVSISKRIAIGAWRRIHNNIMV